MTWALTATATATIRRFSGDFVAVAVADNVNDHDHVLRSTRIGIAATWDFSTDGTYEQVLAVR